MTWHLYDATGAPYITQYNAISAPSSTTVDGSAAASLTNVALTDGGKIVANYSNGTQVTWRNWRWPRSPIPSR